MDANHENQQTMANSELSAQVAEMEAMLKARLAEKADLDSELESKKAELAIVEVERDEAKEEYYSLKSEVERMQAENAMGRDAIRLAQNQVDLLLTSSEYYSWHSSLEGEYTIS